MPDAAWHRCRTVFHGFRLDDAGTEAGDRAAARDEPAISPIRTPRSASPRRAPIRPAHGVPTVAMATAHPAKFPDAIERATGIRPALPPRLADLFDRPERFTVLPNDLAAVEAQVRALARRNA